MRKASSVRACRRLDGDDEVWEIASAHDDVDFEGF